ncbi:glycosyltransferase family 4 protein [Ornithinimicrobium kibberense]|uniref:Glycosyltransferase family 4 protein n=1 Tax=Ornithinimicrobium kibberense TaxID=282060 RepID=A0ABV5V0U2_9MICO|nr:glycosyltransferase family 4 protein [Ornithinimicrobium kibberense]
MSLTVAYVCADPGIPVFGTKGASVHIQELVRAWRARGARVEVFAVRRGDDVPADLADLPVHVVPVAKVPRERSRTVQVAERERAQQRAAAQLARMVTELAPDVVHERYSLFSTVLGQVQDVLDARGADVATILEVNAPLIDEQRTHRVLVDETAAREALADQLAAADVVACVSEPVADWVRGEHDRQARQSCHIGRPDDRCDTTAAHIGQGVGPAVVVTPNGVNTDRIRPTTPDLSDDPVVVFVGTLKPWHGVEDLLRGAALARRPWRLRIVGDGPQRSAVEELAATCGRPVELVGAVAPDQVPGTLEGALVAVAPYPESGDHYFSPLKVYEYAAAALPVVASRIGQIPQVVEHGRTGLLVPPSDPAALARAIDDLVADPARAQELGRAGRALMVEHHSWHAVLDATLAPLGRPGDPHPGLARTADAPAGATPYPGGARGVA